MLREKFFSPFVQKELQTEWRGREISRIEGFSDAVFGFAVTLLVVALEVPRTSGELLETMRGFGSFLITFGILFSIWYRQFIFFRRYGLEDRTTVVLNGILIVVVLFFVYPLKFIISALLGRLEGGSKSAMLADGRVVPIIDPGHRPYLFAIYGFGLAAVFLVFALLYRHAYRNRDVLKLTDVEAYDTRDSFSGTVWVAVMGVIIGLASLATLLSFFNGDAGQLLIAAVEIVAVVRLFRLRTTRKKRREKFLAQLSAATADVAL
ncbi:MAG: TMEM175 family protein [Gemmatimonadota bacterium]|nr:TMEM175 family protein [Gemmatimonadota bacterium]